MASTPATNCCTVVDDDVAGALIIEDTVELSFPARDYHVHYVHMNYLK